MKKVIYILIVIALVLSWNTNVAAARIRGKVIDVYGERVANATVKVEGLNLEDKTSKDGSFSIKKVPEGNYFLYVKSPSKKYLDSETLKSIRVKNTDISNITITLSGRPGDNAEYVGISVCKKCHEDQWPEIFKAFDGSPTSSVHSRMVNPGTSQMIYPELWPEPGSYYVPLDPKGRPLMVQDPLDGKGLVNVVLCTEDGKNGRKYLFKFYPEQPDGKSLDIKDLNGSRKTKNAIWIPVGGTIGGQDKWGEGYTDPKHIKTDKYHDFGEGKQRFLARVQDVPYLKKWMEDHGVPVEKAKQDYVSFMPVYIMQDGTPAGSKVLSKDDVGTPKFWQKAPTHWCTPTNTLSRNCAGCHATGMIIKTKDFIDSEHTFKSVVTEFDYKDLNITCEKCHGPGSEHVSSGDKSKIIMPQFLTVKANNETCGTCHEAHDGKSKYPAGIHKYPYNQRTANSIGHGFFVPGIYDMDDFYFNNDKPRVNNDWREGPFLTWPDQTHGRAHSMQLCELNRSVHAKNDKQKLTCMDCHDAHTLDGGPASLKIGEYDFKNAAYNNNTLCLTCHSGKGDFKNITVNDVGILQLEAGFKVTKNNQKLTYDKENALLAKNRVAKDIAVHMQKRAGMGGALYTPEDPDMPTGRCTSCHMPKTGKLYDLNDDAQYHLDFDKNGMSAVAEGNVGSHVFDIIWPGQSSILKNPDPSQGHDYDIMPNSCSKCHAFARISGDND